MYEQVILKDPKYVGNCVEILQELTHILKTSYDTAGQG